MSLSTAAAKSHEFLKTQQKKAEEFLENISKEKAVEEIIPKKLYIKKLKNGGGSSCVKKGDQPTLLLQIYELKPEGDELEIQLLVAEKIQEIYSSYGQDSKESEKILTYLKRTGKSLCPEDYEVLGLREIMHILPEFVVEEVHEDIFGTECGLFSNIKKIWTKHKKVIIAGIAVVVAFVTGKVLSEKKEAQPPTPPPPAPSKKTRPSQSSPPQKASPIPNPPESLVLPPTTDPEVVETTLSKSSTGSKFDLPPLQWKTTKANEGPTFLEPSFVPPQPVKIENYNNPSQPALVTDNSLNQTIPTLEWIKDKLPQQPSYNTKRTIEPFKADPSLIPTDQDIANTPQLLLPQEPVLAATLVPDFTPRNDFQVTYSLDFLRN